MLKGGYHIVDFKENNITSTGVTILGIYDSLEHNYNKPILVTGIVLESVPQVDCFVNLMVANTNYTFTAYGKTFTIDEADLVKAE